MKYIRLAILVLTFFCAAPSLVHTQGEVNRWDILNQEVIDLYRAGKFDRAALVAQKALQVAKQNIGLGHPNLATSLNNMALICDTQGDNAKAEQLYKRALTIKENTLSPPTTILLSRRALRIL